MTSKRQVETTCSWVNDRLIAYLHGNLDAEQQAKLRAHLAGCPACRAQYSTFQAVQSRLSAEKPAPVAPLSTAAKRRMVEQVLRKRKIGDLMNNTNKFARQIFGIAVLSSVVIIAAFLVNGLLRWQQPEDGLPAASQPAPVNDRSGDDPNSVTITFAAPDSLRKQFQALADQFHLQNPHITVQLRDASSLAANASTTDPTSGMAAGADSAYAYIDPQAAVQGMLYDLSTFIEADPTFQKDDFFPGMLQAFTWQGKTWALPSQADLTFLVQDKALFAESGLEPLNQDVTQAAFADAALKLTRQRSDGKMQYGFVDQMRVGEVTMLAGRIDEALRLQRLDMPEIEAMMAWYADLSQATMPEPLEGTEGFTRDQTLISNGQAAMWSDLLFNARYYSAKGRTIGILPFPAQPSGAVRATMYGYFISSGTHHPQEAWQWLVFLSRNYISQHSNDDKTLLPARRSTAEQIQYWSQFEDDMRSMVQYAAEHLSFSPFYPGRPDFHIADALVSMRKDGKALPEALSQAQAAFAKELGEASLVQPKTVQVATPDPTPQPDDIIIRFYYLGLEQYTLQGVLQAYQQQHPEVQVELIEPGQEDNIDCGTNSFSNPRSLRSMIEADPSFSWDDYYTAARSFFEREGEIWGVPWELEARVVRYNRKLFDEAGVPYPSPDWTWDDFLRTAQALTRQTERGQQYGYVANLGEIADLPNVIASQSVQMWDETGQANFTTPQAADAVRLYTDMALQYGVMPLLPDAKNGELDGPGIDARAKLIKDGQAAMWMEFTGYFNDSYLENGEVGTAPMPRGNMRASDYFINGLTIAQDTNHAEACWDLIKYLSQQPALVKGIPAHRDVLASTEHQANTDAELLEVERLVLEETVNTNAWLPENPWAAMSLRHVLGEVYSGIPVEEALLHGQQWWEENKGKEPPTVIAP